MMKRICAWCDRSMGERMGPDILTHGICPQCEAKVYGEILARKQVCPRHGPYFPAKNFADDGYGCPECDREKEFAKECQRKDESGIPFEVSYLGKVMDMAFKAVTGKKP